MAINQRRVDEIVNICHDLQSKYPINAFSLLSTGTFQLENFHSKVIAGLLDPQQRHGRSEQLMSSFVSMLADKADSIGKNEVGASVRKVWGECFYEGVEVETEYPVVSDGHHGRIDLLLRNGRQKKAIIIEPLAVVT